MKEYLKHPEKGQEYMVEAVRWMQYSLDLDKTYQFLSTIHLESAIFRDHHLRNLGHVAVTEAHELQFVRFKIETLAMQIISRVYNYLFREQGRTDDDYSVKQEKAIVLGNTLFDLVYSKTGMVFDTETLKATEPGFRSRLRKAETEYYRQITAVLENSGLFDYGNKAWFQELFSAKELSNIPGLHKIDQKDAVNYYMSAEEYVTNWDMTNIAFVWDTITANYFTKHKPKEIDYNHDEWYISCMAYESRTLVVRLFEQFLNQLDELDSPGEYSPIQSGVFTAFFSLYELSKQWGIDFEDSNPYWTNNSFEDEVNELKRNYGHYIKRTTFALGKYASLENSLSYLENLSGQESFKLKSTLEKTAGALFHYRAYSDFHSFGPVNLG
jgi:hypothetical protein